MVVVSGGWMKNVQYVNYVDQQADGDGDGSGDMVIPTTDAPAMGGARAVLVGRPNSHPFQERTLALDQPIKVGRSVARARATPTNAIFDCKVLSRHHALLWYDCGKFYLQDTKSSNGTFVNNNRLSSTESEPHEVSSGDIVQFGVDVVENNRKVTHGCIIATLKLYLPDGKEAKASPSITEGNRHGLVPLDELYKLHQVIQEASQREQCLETKLTALQHVVEAARRAADESWQAYVGEERLLSRVAALETQLMQASKGFGDDRLREELNKLQEDRAEYQVAAKEALRKLHAERLEAVAAASEQQRARATAEHEAILAKEQLELAQQELQDIAQKLSEEQKRSDEERAQLEQNEKELQAQLEAESQNAGELQKKLDYLKQLAFRSGGGGGKVVSLASLDNYDLLYDELSAKEELIAENEGGQGDGRKSNGGLEDPEDQNHINLTVAPVVDSENRGVIDDCETDTNEPEESLTDEMESTKIDTDGCSTENKDKASRDCDRECTMVEFDGDVTQVEEKADNGAESKTKEDEPTTERTEPVGEVDARTLKYQYQTVQNELKKQIERLEIASSANKTKIALLEKSLLNERDQNSFLSSKSDLLKEEFASLEKRHQDNVGAKNSLTEEVLLLREQLDELHRSRAEEETSKSCETSEKASQFEAVEEEEEVDNISSIEELRDVETELVLLKERYALANEEKLTLKKEVLTLRDSYNALRDRSHNAVFFYVAPLVLMVLYLLISSMFS